MKAKRIIALVAAFALYMLPTAPMRADTGSALFVLTNQGTNIASTELNISKASYVRVQVWSQAGSTAVVSVNGRSCPGTSGIVNCAAPWFTVATITNPDGVQGQYWSIPVMMRIQLVISSWVAGSISATVETHQITP